MSDVISFTHCVARRRTVFMLIAAVPYTTVLCSIAVHYSEEYQPGNCLARDHDGSHALQKMSLGVCQNLHLAPDM